MHTLVLLCSLAAADPAPGNLTTRAKEFVAAMSRGDFAAATKEFDDTMLKVLPAEKLKTTWESVTKAVGDFKEQTATRTETKDKFEIVFVTCQFERMALDARVVFNTDKKISGLQFLPPKPKVEYKWPDYVSPDSFAEKEVNFAAEAGWELPGTLTTPKGDGPFPAVVLLHGSGPNDRDESIGANKPFRDLAGGLATRGIVVLRFEKRTRQHGAKLSAGTVTVKEEVLDDALAAVKLLRQSKGVDASRVFVLGHSLGATMAPQLGTLDAKLAGLIIMAGATRPIEDLIVEQIDYLGRLNGEPDALVLEKLSKIKEQVAKVKDPNLSPATPAEQLPFGVAAPYWLSLRGYEPAKVATKLTMPILILHGDRDYQVTLDDYARWDKELGGRANVTLKRYVKLNHLFLEGEGKSTPTEYQQATHVAKSAIEDIAAWMKK